MLLFLCGFLKVMNWYLVSQCLRVIKLCKWKTSRLPISEPRQLILLMYSGVIISMLEVFVLTVYSRDSHNQTTELSLMVIQYPGRHTNIQGHTTLQPVNWATGKVLQDHLHLIGVYQVSLQAVKKLWKQFTLQTTWHRPTDQLYTNSFTILS